MNVDVPVMAVDGCKDTAKQISAHQRVNAAAVSDRSKTTDTALDTWHGDKTGGKNQKKYVTKSGPELSQFFSQTVVRLANETGVAITRDVMDEVVSLTGRTGFRARRQQRSRRTGAGQRGLG